MGSGEFAALDIASRRSTGEPEMFIIRTGRLGCVGVVMIMGVCVCVGVWGGMNYEVDAEVDVGC